ncbi:hypothetical protein ABW19_dt0205355 [Dactylella cylindrospora]|nr:hypothetical protein ABW19_dt0205355 [Dactylella cylindrospora]
MGLEEEEDSGSGISVKIWTTLAGELRIDDGDDNGRCTGNTFHAWFSHAVIYRYRQPRSRNDLSDPNTDHFPSYRK